MRVHRTGVVCGTIISVAMVSGIIRAQAAQQPPATPPEAPGANPEPAGTTWPGRNSMGLLIGSMDPVEILRTHPEADTDKDGQLNPREMRLYLDARQAAAEKELLAAHPEMDTDRDGRLSAAEVRAGRAIMEEFAGPRMLAEHPEADLDRDGVLSRSELREFQMGQVMNRTITSGSLDYVIQNFKSFDLDGNGQLSMEELQAARERTKPMLRPTSRPGMNRGRMDGADRARQRLARPSASQPG